MGRVWHLFSSKMLAIRTSILYFNWYYNSTFYSYKLYSEPSLKICKQQKSLNYYTNKTISIAQFPPSALTLVLMSEVELMAEPTNIKPCHAEPRYTLPLQTV